MIVAVIEHVFDEYGLLSGFVRLRDRVQESGQTFSEGEVGVFAFDSIPEFAGVDAYDEYVFADDLAERGVDGVLLFFGLFSIEFNDDERIVIR
jgi:hypothetical protein